MNTVPVREVKPGDKIVHPGRYLTMGKALPIEEWTVEVVEIDRPEEYDGERFEITYREPNFPNTHPVIVADDDWFFEVVGA